MPAFCAYIFTISRIHRVVNFDLRFMIQSFKDKQTQRLFEGKRVPEFQVFARQAERRLRVLDAADTLEALMMLPSNRFKALGGIFIA